MNERKVEKCGSCDRETERKGGSVGIICLFLKKNNGNSLKELFKYHRTCVPFNALLNFMILRNV